MKLLVILFCDNKNDFYVIFINNKVTRDMITNGL